MKDIVGNSFEVGDKVATDVTVNKSSSLRVGTVTAVDEDGYVKVSYSIKTRWGAKKILNKSVWRAPNGVVKVANDVQA